MLEILGRIELLLYVPGMRGLISCWLDGDGNFGVGRGRYGLVFYIACVRESRPSSCICQYPEISGELDWLTLTKVKGT